LHRPGDKLLLVGRVGLGLSQFKVRLQRGQGGAQLMRGVGDKALQGGHRVLHLRRHSVERPGQAPDLVGAPDIGPHSEVAPGHLVAGSSDGMERSCQIAAAHPPDDGGQDHSRDAGQQPAHENAAQSGRPVGRGFRHTDSGERCAAAGKLRLDGPVRTGRP